MRWRNLIIGLILAALVGLGVIALGDTTKLNGTFEYNHALSGGAACLGAEPAVGTACVDSFEIGIQKSDGALEVVGTVPATGTSPYSYSFNKVLSPGIYTVYVKADGRFKYGSGQQAYVSSALVITNVFGGFHAPFNFTARAE